MTVYKGEPTKDGRCYYFRDYKKVNGELKDVKSKKYLTKKEAEQEERLFLMQKNNPYRKEFDLVVKDYIKYIYQAKKESTAVSYETIINKNILPYFDKKDINSINVRDINNWKKIMLENNFKKKYLNKNYSVLKNIFDFAMKNYDLERNVVQISGAFEIANEDVVSNEEKIRYITYDEFKQFVSVIDDDFWYTFFNFLFYTGMRKGEIQALTWNDIDFDNNYIKVNKTLSVKTKAKENYKITNTKNYLNRDVKMNRTLIDIMVKYQEKQKQFKNYSDDWFVFGSTHFLPSTSIDRYKDMYFDLSKVHRITIHEFRHSHVTMCLNEYLNSCKKNNIKIDSYSFFIKMSKRMGHTIDVMLKTYGHLVPNIQDEIVDLLDNL